MLLQRIVRVLAALLIALPLFIGARVTVHAAPAAREVQAGAGSADQAVQLPMFFPATLTIDVGDSITWKTGSGLPHTVSFGTPPPTFQPDQIAEAFGGLSFDGTGFVSSGIILPAGAPKEAGPQSYTLTFPKVGTFKYVCLFHQPAMTGTVVVQPAGSPYPADQTAYRASADPRVAPALAAGAAALAAQTVDRASNPDGTTTYTLNAGYGDGKSFILLRFGSPSLTVHVGDHVRWIQQEPDEVHTVTFRSGGPPVPIVIPPKNAINPRAAAPAGGPRYDGTGYVNSGLLLPPPAPVAARTFTLTFTRPGSYDYECVVHDELGMKGTIVVLAAAPSGLPRTGGMPRGAGATLGLLGLALIGSGTLLLRRMRRAQS